MAEAFPNTPAEVEAVIRNLPPRQRLPDLRYLASAAVVISHYLERDLNEDLGDSFMRLDRRTPDDRSWEFTVRLVQLAEVLFSLRNEPGFGEICRRMSRRDLRSAYGELAVAAMIMRHGFVIYARPEIGRKTEDFDFSIGGSGMRANVEVWTLNQLEFRSETVLKRLKVKRRQLPDDAPAIIGCVFPEAWFDQIDRLYDHFDALAERFFGGTKRINWLFFAHEEFSEQLPLGGYLTLNSYAVPHPAPRLPSAELNAMLAAPPDTQEAMDRFVAQPKGPFYVQQQDEFHRWINWLVSG